MSVVRVYECLLFKSYLFQSWDACSSTTEDVVKSEFKFKPDPSGSSSSGRRGNRADFGEHHYLVSAKTTKKDTFFCNVCKVELNSIETRNTHTAGQRHMVTDQLNT